MQRLGVSVFALALGKLQLDSVAPPPGSCPWSGLPRPPGAAAYKPKSPACSSPTSPLQAGSKPQRQLPRHNSASASQHREVD